MTKIEKGKGMQKSKNVPVSVRISPEAKELVQKAVEGSFGHGLIIDKAIKAYFAKK
jgi:hypothetical protein